MYFVIISYFLTVIAMFVPFVQDEEEVSGLVRDMTMQTRQDLIVGGTVLPHRGL